jgi:hypothetical protein
MSIGQILARVIFYIIIFGGAAFVYIIAGWLGILTLLVSIICSAVFVFIIKYLDDH